MINSLTPSQIFVFGSNTAGVHAAGAAKQAVNKFGAGEGVGEGLTGQCYAFPTLGRYMEKRGRSSLENSRRLFFRIAKKNPEKEFLLTRVGCGIAGYEESFMKSLFRNPPKNVVLPKEWI